MITVFSKEWFEKYNKQLWWVANSLIGQLVFRFRKFGHYTENKIVKITPNSVIELIEIKGDKMAIGGQQLQETKVFSNHQMKLEKGDRIYLTTDGFADQFGGVKNKKFMRKMLKHLISTSQKYSMSEQKQVLSEAYERWKGNNEQVDDILIIGIQV